MTTPRRGRGRGSLSSCSSLSSTPPPGDLSLQHPSDGSDSPDMPIPSRLKSLLIYDFPPRGDNISREGRPISLIANMFRVTLPSGTVYQYDVDFSAPSTGPSTLSSTVRQRLLKLVFQANPMLFAGSFPIFDGKKNMYSAKPYSFQSRVFPAQLQDERGDCCFSVKIQLAAQWPMEAVSQFQRRSSAVPQALIQALDVLLRFGPAQRHVQIGRSLFAQPTGPIASRSLGGGLEIWKGFFQSVRIGQNWTFLNVDTVATAFYEEGPLLDFVRKVLQNRGQRFEATQACSLTEAQVNKLKRKLSGVKVKVTHLPYPRKYAIKSVTFKSAKELCFGDPPQSVAAYFASTYGALRFPNLQCINVGKKDTYLPMEVCEIVEKQQCKKKLDEQQTADMIRKSVVSCKERFRVIQQGLDSSLKDSAPVLQQYNIHVDSIPTQLEGRVIPPPGVVYNASGVVQPRQGSWNLRPMYRPSELSVWAVLSFSMVCSEDIVVRFAKLLISTAKEFSMTIANPSVVKSCPPRAREFTYPAVKAELEEMLRKTPSCQLCLVILPATSSIYALLKSDAETRLGLLTQVVLDKNVTRGTRAILENLLQKINTKLGGINSSITTSLSSVFKVPVIVIGADVTHSSRFDASCYSIAALCGSLDTVPSRFACTVSAQDIRGKKARELIDDLSEMIKKLLLAFYKATPKLKPHKIFYYRDGVSEGQFRAVLQHELAGIRKACLELSPGGEYQPDITFVTVQKRHHVRFQPTKPEDECGRAGNVPPGTVVDNTVVHPRDYDFYLCSHFGIQGTSRPAHYYVLWDDNKMSQANLEKLTYSLCHTYARCTRTVSIPAPVYYAHLAAFRARHHLLAKDVRSDSSGSAPLDLKFIEESIRVLPNVGRTMYFI